MTIAEREPIEERIKNAILSLDRVLRNHQSTLGTASCMDIRGSAGILMDVLSELTRKDQEHAEAGKKNGELFYFFAQRGLCDGDQSFYVENVQEYVGKMEDANRNLRSTIETKDGELRKAREEGWMIGAGDVLRERHDEDEVADWIEKNNPFGPSSTPNEQ